VRSEASDSWRHDEDWLRHVGSRTGNCAHDRLTKQPNKRRCSTHNYRNKLAATRPPAAPVPKTRTPDLLCSALRPPAPSPSASASCSQRPAAEAEPASQQPPTPSYLPDSAAAPAGQGQHTTACSHTSTGDQQCAHQLMFTNRLPASPRGPPPTKQRTLPPPPGVHTADVAGQTTPKASKHPSCCAAAAPTPTCVAGRSSRTLTSTARGAGIRAPPSWQQQQQPGSVGHHCQFVSRSLHVCFCRVCHQPEAGKPAAAPATCCWQ